MPKLQPHAASPHSRPRPVTAPLPTSAAAPQSASASSSVDSAIKKLEEFELNARESAHLADQVSRCIRKVQARLNLLPAKIAASVIENGEEVSFERSGRTWSLFYTNCEEDDRCSSKTQATHASLEVKIRIVQLIPSLLNEMFTRQTSALKRLRACKPIMEEFAELPDVDDPQVDESDYDSPSAEMSNEEVPF